MYRYLDFKIIPNHIDGGFIKLEISGYFKNRHFKKEQFLQFDEFDSLFDRLFDYAKDEIKSLYYEKDLNN